MSDTNRLGIQITAVSDAGATLSQLKNTVKALQDTLSDAGKAGAGAGSQIVAVLQAEIAAINAEIAARTKQAAAIKTVTAAVKEQAEALAVVHRSLQQNLDLSFGVGADREIKSASASARVLATSLSAAAEADARLRVSELATAEAVAKNNAAMLRRGALVKSLSGEAFFGAFNRKQGIGAGKNSAEASAGVFEKALGPAGASGEVRQEATYINRDLDLAYEKGRKEAEYENAGRNAVAQQQRQAAEYINRDLDLAYAKGRAEAEYENAGRLAAEKQTRAEANYINRDLDLAQAKGRKEAEYENAGRIAAARQTRSAAEYENRDKDLAYAAMRRQADYENAEYDRKAAFSARTINQTQREAAAKIAAVNAEYDAMRKMADYENRNFDLARRRREQSERSTYGTGMARHGVAIFDESMRGNTGQMVSSIGAAAREANLGVLGLSASVAGLVALMGGEAIIRSAENMGKWATEVKSGAAAAGMTVTQYSALSALFTQLGQRSDEADSTLRHLGETLSKALADPSSLAAEAFHNLGISQEALVKNGADTYGALGLVAEAFRRTANDGNKTANVAELLGRGFEKLIPALDQGKAGLDGLTESMRQTGRVIDSEVANKLEKTGQDIREVGESIKSGAVPAMVAWGPTIVAITQELGAFAQVLETGISKLGTWVQRYREAAAARKAKDESLGDYFADGMLIPGMGKASAESNKAYNEANALQSPEQMGPAATKTKAQPLEPPITVLSQMRLDMAAAGAAASAAALAAGASPQQARIREEEAEIAVMQKTLVTAKLTGEQRTQVETELNQKIISLNNSRLSAGASAAKQDYANFAAGEKEKIAEANGNGNQILAIYDEWLNAAAVKYKQNASVILGIEREKVQEINKLQLQQLEDAQKSTQQKDQLTKLNAEYTQVSSPTYKPANDLGPGQLNTQAAQLRAEAAQIEAAAQKQISDFSAVAAAATEGSDIQRKAQQDITTTVIQAKTEEITLYKQAAAASGEAAKKTSQAFVQFFDTLGSGLEQFQSSALKALLAPQQEVIHAGLTTIRKNMGGQEIATAFRSLILNSITSLGSSVENALSHTIANALSGGASNSIGELMGNWLSKAFSSVIGSGAGSAAGAALGGGAAAAGTTAASAGLTTAAAGLTTASAGLDTAGVSLNTAAVSLTTAAASLSAGGAGGGIGGIIDAGVFARGGIVPSAAGGMVVGGMGASLAILHAKEMVLPAHLSTGIQGLINGGNSGRGSGGNVANLNYSPTINTASRGRGGTGMTRSEFSQMMSTGRGALLGEARNLMRSGWRPG